MINLKTSRWTLAPFMIVSAILFYGCEGASDSTKRQLGSPSVELHGFEGPQDTVIVAAPPNVSGGEPVATVIDARPAAIVDSRVVTWGELRPILNELAGARALQEFILDRKISEALDDENRSISPDDVSAEKKRLLESLNDDPNVALRLLDELRIRQHLGAYRFNSLMRRNASLRALVQDQVVITDHAVKNMHEMIHGPKRQGRIIVVDDLATADSVVKKLTEAELFVDLAVEYSTDSSAPRGGLIEPMSRIDPAYPQALRLTLWALSTAEVSNPVLIDEQYVLIKLENEFPGDGIAIEEDRISLERLVRLSQERMLMDQLARRLLSDASVTVFDSELNNSWSRRSQIQ